MPSKQPGMEKTIQQFEKAAEACRSVFFSKMNDYGTAWRILRPSSITDQIFIKASRIRSIEEKGARKIEEDATAEFIGIVNYSIMGLIQLELGPSDLAMDPAGVARHYDLHFGEALELMRNKNHDYGEAWRDMRISSYTDLILMKLKRVKQIEDHLGQTLVSEGVAANYLDIINYAVFALIKLKFE